jgi:serine/threonine-protein kinase
MARPMTDAGMILGTAAYMSPEQARGKAVDKRSDIWSFGVVLHEMLTGKRLFSGETVSDTLAAVLRHEIDLDELPDGATPALRRILERCLERNPRNRLHDVADARIELTRVDASAVQQAGRPTEGRAAGRAFWLGWAVAGAALLLAGTLATPLVRSSFGADDAAPGVLRFQFLPSDGERLIASDGNKMMRAFAISPDGSHLAYAVERGATSELRLRSLGSSQSVVIPGTQGATSPFFSPDGKWIGFATGLKLKKVAVAGGMPVTLADARGFRGAVWSDDGSIYFVPDLYVPISRIPAAGGPARAVTRIRTAEGEMQHRWPEILPGGKVLLYAIGGGADWDEATIVAERLDTGERKVLVRGGTSPRYLRQGTLVYARASGLYAMSFDARSLEVSGQPVEVARNVYLDPRGNAHMDVARSGLLMTLAADRNSNATVLSWVDREGRGETLNVPAGPYGFIALSPQEDRAALSIGNAVATVDLTRGSVSKLTLERRAENPVWSHDGRRLYFGYEQGKSYQIHSKAADDSGDVQLTVASDLQEDPFAASRDGSQLLAIRFTPSGLLALTVYDMRGPQPRGRALLQAPSLDGISATFSPNGRWVVYQSTESGRPEIYVRPTSGQDRKWRVSVDGGTHPVWSPLGDEIFFLSGARFLSATCSEKGDEIVTGPPTVLFANHRVASFAAARDGKRFLVAEDPDSNAQPWLDAVVGWSAEVQKKLREAGGS